MAVQIRDLFEVPEHIPTVAGRIYDEFWVGKGRLTAEAIAQLLGRAVRDDSIPLSLLALKSGEPVGTVNLIENDDEHRLHLRPWLAALFVLPAHRHCGIGSMLVRALQARAAQHGIQEMYLGTDNPGFIAGWAPLCTNNFPLTSASCCFNPICTCMSGPTCLTVLSAWRESTNEAQ